MSIDDRDNGTRLYLGSARKGEAEDGYDVDEMLSRRRGRPLIGSGPAMVESVRLDPELRESLEKRAARDHESVSALIRKALRQYLIGDEMLAAEGSGWTGDLDEIRSPDEESSAG